MPKSANQKLKLLYMARILLTKTDEAHPMPLEQIKRELSACGVEAERKSLYDDMEALRTFGIDVQMVRDPKARYFVAEREFELPELKLLVDSVQSSRFLTQKKTCALIKKLEKLCSHYEAQLMRRQVYVADRVKTMNESIFYNVDCIHSAIAGDRMVSFKYFEFDADKKKRYRHGGGRYCVSPFALMLSNETYYLLAYDAAAELIKHYRVDKMDSIQLLEAPRQGGEAFAEVDVASYAKHTFGMFGGERQRATLEFSDKLAGVVIDRFGKDVPFIPAGEGRFCIHADVTVSPQFYAWMFALGPDARIAAPGEVAAGMAAQLGRVAALYSETGGRIHETERG
ncbi:MAG TPA: WYL domain-containing protein [Clostridia bacterium]|nr:WYL domain-containing protein [Clostridia bacterium]